jgi:hypothetical protein
LDGVEVGSTSKSGAIATDGAVSINLGRNPGGSANPFSGTIDDMRIYDKALNINEIAAVMSGN